jgi:GNAT superfamily N-acetyltransferase
MGEVAAAGSRAYGMAGRAPLGQHRGMSITPTRPARETDRASAHRRHEMLRTEPAVAPGRAAAGRITLRPVEPEDLDDVARIVHVAFAGIHDHHRFARDFPTLESAVGMASAFIAHPAIWGVVAELDGRVVGSNFLDERGPVRGVGPITVDPAVQGSGAGRLLLEAVLERGAGAAGIRLLQDAFNTRSLGLYASLGFDVAEPVALIAGRPRGAAVPGAEVRPLTEADVAAAERLHRRVHGFERTAELRDALATPGFAPVAAERDGRLVAYATTLTYFAAAHAVAETEADMAGLILGALAGEQAEASFLLPTRQSQLFRRCLAEGLRVIKPMTYMTVGPYTPPAGAWIPSVLY